MMQRTRSRPSGGKTSFRALAFTFPLVFILTACCLLGEAKAYSIPNSVFGNGGEKTSSGIHTVNGTIGQPLVGISSLEQAYKVASGVWHDTCGILWTGASDELEHGSELPARYSLAQNYPNPFNPTTTIEFTLPKRSHITLKLYNILGEVVAKLVDEDLPPGEHEVTVNGENLPSGVYFYRLAAPDFVKAKKLVLLK